MKVVINQCFGGFGLSREALEMLLKRKGIEYEVVQSKSFDYYVRESLYRKGHAGDDEFYLSDYDFYDKRADEDLVAVVEELGEDANGHSANLKIVEIPDDVDWYIDENDGLEHVAERHRTWS
jgi:hypothetical protein